MARKKSKGFTKQQGELLKALYGTKKLIDNSDQRDAQEDLFSASPEPNLDTLVPQNTESQPETTFKTPKELLKSKITVEKTVGGFTGALMNKYPELTEVEARKKVKDALMHTIETGEFVDLFGTGEDYSQLIDEVKGAEVEPASPKTSREKEVAENHLSKIRGMLDDESPSSHQPQRPRRR